MYNVSYEMCTILFLIVLMANFFSRRQMWDRQSEMFRCLLLLVFGYLLLDILLYVTVSKNQTLPFANTVIHTAVLLTQDVIQAVFVMYITVLGQRQEKRKRSLLLPALVPMFMLAAALLANLFAGFLFYYDESGYRYGKWYVLIYALILLYLAGVVAYVAHIRKELTAGQLWLILLTMGVAAATVVLQYFNPDYSLTGAGIGIILFIMYLTIEDPTVYADSLTSALNRQAFVLRAGQMREKGKFFHIIAIALDNFKIVNEVFGMEGGNILLQMLAEQLQGIYPKSQVFRYNGDIFTIILEEKYESTKEIDKIRKILRRRWSVNGVDVELSACICRIPPKFFMMSDSELVKALDYAIGMAKAKGKNQYFELDEETAKDMARTAAIEQAMMSAIEEEKFEVHYQPIYDTKHQRFHSMEALARLNVPGYGYVSPEEFIRIAEQNGMIMKIGILVLEEVCRVISEHRLQERGIEFVEVNLSVVQCMQENCHEVVSEVLKQYGIQPEMINLEITESAAVNSEEKLVHNMARLSLTDITFSLDDYGSGYSNINYLADLPFTIVKIDKYFVWAAFKKVRMRKILENTIAMFRDINLKIVAEGIEDEEMAKVLTDMGAHYLQGYHYAKPMTKDKMLRLLQGGES